MGAVIVVKQFGGPNWHKFRKILDLVLKAIEGTPAILPQFIPGYLMEDLAAPWVFQEARACVWCGGHSGRYRAGDAAFGALHFCADCWSLDAFAPDGSRVTHVSRRYSKILSSLPPGAHVTEVEVRDGAIVNLVWNTDPPDDQKYDCYYAYFRDDYGIAFMEFLRLIEKENYSSAYWYLSEMCLKGGAGLSADAATALKWCRLGAEQGHTGCQCELGRRCERGEGMEVDLHQAVSWYRRAAAAGAQEGRPNLPRGGPS